jgi:hypothetical protein
VSTNSGQVQKLDLVIGDHIEYAYELGDNWQHVLEVEARLPATAGTVYPRCARGECSAPPEDVGGVSGYKEFLEALFDPEHEEHEDMKSRIGRPFHPTSFSMEEANERLRKRLRPPKSQEY